MKTLSPPSSSYRRLRVWLFLGLGLGLFLLVGALMVLGSPWLIWELKGREAGTIIVSDNRRTEAYLKLLGQYVEGDNLLVPVSFPSLVKYNLSHRGELRQYVRPLYYGLKSGSLYPDVLGLVHGAGENDKYFVRGDVSTDGIKVLLSQEIPLAKEPKESELQGEGFLVNVKGEDLRFLPAEMQKHWEELIREELSITKTNPALLSAMSRQDKVKILLKDSFLQLSIYSENSADIQSVMRSWINDESRHLNPEEKYFQLPDGTLGREIVPGEVQDSWVSTTHDGCEEFTGFTRVYLCLHDGWSHISTAQDVFTPASELREVRFSGCDEDSDCQFTALHLLEVIPGDFWLSLSI